MLKLSRKGTSGREEDGAGVYSKHRGRARPCGAAAIGGPFTLINSADGKTFTAEHLKGKFALLYFGFTMCPDICPDEMEKMAECINLVEKAGLGRRGGHGGRGAGGAGAGGRGGLHLTAAASI